MVKLSRSDCVRDRLAYTEKQEYERMLAALRDALGADQLAKLVAEGATWTEDRAVAECHQLR